MLVMGFSSEYDPDTPNKYFRYKPLFNQWIVVFLALLLYRRQMALDTGNEEKFSKYRSNAENTIKRRLSWLYRLYVILDIFYNHIIVIVAFTIFLGILILLPPTCINAVS